MKVLIDTNIILEIILQREQATLAKRVLLTLNQGGHQAFITSGGFYGLIFTVDKYLRKVMLMENPRRTDTLRSIMTQILTWVDIAGQDKQTLLDGIRDNNFKDLEDSCQHQAAISQKCDYIITFNIKDFYGAEIPVYTPEQMLSFLQNNA